MQAFLQLARPRWRTWSPLAQNLSPLPSSGCSPHRCSRPSSSPAQPVTSSGGFARHRVEIGLGDKLGNEVADKALVSAVRKSVARIEGEGAKQLKAALAEAQAGMRG